MKEAHYKVKFLFFYYYLSRFIQLNSEKNIWKLPEKLIYWFYFLVQNIFIIYFFNCSKYVYYSEFLTLILENYLYQIMKKKVYSSKLILAKNSQDLFHFRLVKKFNYFFLLLFITLYVFYQYIHFFHHFLISL